MAYAIPAARCAAAAAQRFLPCHEQHPRFSPAAQRLPLLQHIAARFCQAGRRLRESNDPDIDHQHYRGELASPRAAPARQYDILMTDSSSSHIAVTLLLR